MFNPNRHHRRSVRLPHYDYASGGAYFVTVCAARKQPVFGRLENGAVRLHPYGKIVMHEWERTALLRADVELDEFIVMPDHFHGIITIRRGTPAACPDELIIAELGTPAACPYGRRFGGAEAGALSTIIGQFKLMVTKRINAYRAERNLSPVKVWQRSFYERIIRDENELLQTRRYIIENPLHVEHDNAP